MTFNYCRFYVTMNIKYCIKSTQEANSQLYQIFYSCWNGSFDLHIRTGVCIKI